MCNIDCVCTRLFGNSKGDGWQAAFHTKGPVADVLLWRVIGQRYVCNVSQIYQPALTATNNELAHFRTVAEKISRLNLNNLVVLDE